MYLYFESFGKNLTATIFGLFFWLQEVPAPNLEEKSATFLLLTIVIPSIISGVVTISIEWIKSKKGRK